MRSLSNLIKSQKVEIGIPVNVGINTSFDTVSMGFLKKEGSRQSDTEVLIRSTNVKKTKLSPSEERTMILEEYHKEAMKKAEEEYNAEIKRAYDEGIEKAQSEAKRIIANANAEYENILNEIVRLKEETISEYKRDIKNMEKEIIDLSFEIAEKVINYEVEKSDEYIIGIIKDVLARAVDKKDVTLRLSNEDYSMVLSKQKLLIARIKGFGEVEIVQDEALTPGSCIVDSPYGIMDSSLQVRMNKVQDEVEKILAKG